MILKTVIYEKNVYHFPRFYLKDEFLNNDREWLNKIWTQKWSPELKIPGFFNQIDMQRLNIQQ